jgi:hypothetical protein
MVTDGRELVEILDRAFKGSVSIPSGAGLPPRHWKLRLEAYMHEIGHGAVLGWKRIPRKQENRFQDFEMFGTEIEQALWNLTVRTANMHEVRTIATVLGLNRKYGWGLPEAHSVSVGLDSLYKGDDKGSVKKLTRRQLQALVEAVPQRSVAKYVKRSETIISNVVQRMARL